MKRRWCNEKGPHRERHEEVTLRRIALGIAKAKLLPARDVAYLVRLGLVDEGDGRLSLTALGRQRYEDMPCPAEPLHKDEAAIARTPGGHLREPDAPNRFSS